MGRLMKSTAIGDAYMLTMFDQMPADGEWLQRFIGCDTVTIRGDTVVDCSCDDVNHAEDEPT
jgi:hypothetical protein